MAFVDEIVLKAESGKGGNGVVRWLHLRGKEFGGPSGGNGGRGGDVIIRGVRDFNILMRYRGRSAFKAENGHDGSKNDMEGKNGEHAYIDLPLGSRVTDQGTGRVWELMEEGEEHVVFSGGKGGLGNAHFKSSTNQYPDKATSGLPPEKGSLHVEIQLIADAGFIGLPNAGKSSLLQIFTKKNVKVAPYAFTTLEPSLGALYGFILADIPGLIEGAAEGKGLGHKFLRHIRRTKILIHCVSSENEDVLKTYNTVRRELSHYDEELLKKPELIFLTKVDEISEEEIKEKLFSLETTGNHIVPVSILDDTRIKEAQEKLVQFLEAQSK